MGERRELPASPRWEMTFAAAVERGLKVEKYKLKNADVGPALHRRYHAGVEIAYQPQQLCTQPALPSTTRIDMMNAREALAPLAINVLANHASLKIKVPKRKLSACSINTTEAELPFSVYSSEFPMMPNSRNSTLYSPTSTPNTLDFPAFPSHPPSSPPVSPLLQDKLCKTNRLPARQPLQTTSPISPISPQFRLKLQHSGMTPRTVSDMSEMKRQPPIRVKSPSPITPPSPPSSEITVTRRRSRERTAVLQENKQRADGYSRKFMQARILSDLTHNRGRNASSPRSQYAVFRAEAQRVRDRSDMNRSQSQLRVNSPPPPTIDTEIDDSSSFTISTKNSSSTTISNPLSYTMSSNKLDDRAPVQRPGQQVMVRRGPRPAFTQRATSEMVRRRPSQRGRTRSEVEAPYAGNVRLSELHDHVEHGLRQRRVWMQRGKVFKRWQKVHARIEDCATLVLMRNGIIKHYRLRGAVASPAAEARTFKMKGGPRLTAFKVHLDNDKVLTFATEYATEANNWIEAIQRVGDTYRNPVWMHLT